MTLQEISKEIMDKVQDNCPLSVGVEFNRMDEEGSSIMREINHVYFWTGAYGVRHRFYHLLFEGDSYKAWTRNYDPLFISDDPKRVIEWLSNLMIEDYKHQNSNFQMAE